MSISSHHQQKPKQISSKNYSLKYQHTKFTHTTTLHDAFILPHYCT